MFGKMSGLKVSTMSGVPSMKGAMGAVGTAVGSVGNAVGKSVNDEEEEELDENGVPIKKKKG